MAIDKVITDPAQSFSTESHLRDGHGTITKYATASSVANKQNSENSSSSESVHSTIMPSVPKPNEHVFSGTLNNCTINISYK